MTYLFWLGADAEPTAIELETREQQAREAFTVDSTDIDE
jgi:hypothetical protein